MVKVVLGSSWITKWWNDKIEIWPDGYLTFSIGAEVQVPIWLLPIGYLPIITQDVWLHLSGIWSHPISSNGAKSNY